MDSSYQPRIRGISIPQPITPEPVQQAENTEIVDAVQRQSLDTFQRSMQTVQSGTEGNARLTNQIAQNIEGIQGANNVIKAYENIRQGNGGTSGEILNLVRGAYDIYSQVREQRRASLRGQALVQLEREKQEFLAQAEVQLRDPNVGYAGYQRGIQELTNRYSQYLTPEDVITLTSELYAPYGEVLTEDARATYGTFSQIQDHRRNTEINRLGLKYQARLDALRYSRTPQESEELVNQLLSEVTADLSGMLPIDANTLAEFITGSIREAYGESTATFARVSQSLNNFQGYLTDYETEVRAYYDQTGDIVGAQVRDAALRRQYQIEGTTPLSDPLGPQIEENRRLQNRLAVQEAQRSFILEAERALQFTEAEVVTIAWQLYNNPAERSYWENFAGGNSPEIDEALAIADALQSYESGRNEIDLEINELQTRVQQINVQNAEELASYVRGERSIDTNSLIQSLGIASQFNSGLRGLYEAAQQAQQSSDPAELRRVVQDVIRNRAAIVDTLQERSRLLENQLAPQTRILQRYGIATRADLERLAQGAGVTISGIIQEVETARQEARQNLGALPNFSLPQLQTITENGVEVMVPFLPGTHAPINGRLDDPRGDRLHAGIDFAIPVGTEIAMYTQGEVIRIKNDPGGYGHYVDIMSPDGYVHRFADVNDILVQEGDTVAPGQVIALSGNSGNGSAHLHWEIQRGDGDHFGRDSAIDPLEYMAQFRANATQPRNNGSGGGSPRVPGARIFASLDSRETPSGPNSNYGYGYLARNDRFRTRLHQAAQNLGIPTQWLADLMAFETGGTFGADSRNTSTNASGLIQFMPDTARSLGTTVSELRGMTNVQQLDYVERYLREFRDRGELRSPYHLLMAVWGGASNVRDLIRDPASVRRLSDGHITFEDYSRRLGEHAGRQYVPLYDPPPIHTRPRAGCAVCARMGSNFSRHQGS